MGPPFITAEWVEEIACSLIFSSSSFNGAAVHHGGVAGGRRFLSRSHPQASMGPPFITAEWSRGARPIARAAAARFNGAAVHHGGVVVCSRKRSASSTCFNGAAVHHGGVARGLLRARVLRLRRLQWGRRSSRRSGYGRRKSVRDSAHASMGPPFITAEWAATGRRPTPPAQASMGPPFITAEWSAQRLKPPPMARRFNGAAVHHGGVEGLCPPHAPGDSRFNGAAVHHGGVAKHARGAGRRVLLLQWGRRSSRRSGRRIELQRALVELASMGPPFITAEW